MNISPEFIIMGTGILANIFATVFLVGVKSEARFTRLETKMSLIYDSFTKNVGNKMPAQLTGFLRGRISSVGVMNFRVNKFDGAPEQVDDDFEHTPTFSSLKNSASAREAINMPDYADAAFIAYEFGSNAIYNVGDLNAYLVDDTFKNISPSAGFSTVWDSKIPRETETYRGFTRSLLYLRRLVRTRFSRTKWTTRYALISPRATQELSDGIEATGYGSVTPNSHSYSNDTNKTRFVQGNVPKSLRIHINTNKDIVTKSGPHSLYIRARVFSINFA